MSESNATPDAVVDQARDYYDSDDADNFYYHVWGGEDIHVGLYESVEEPILTASHRTVEHMARRLEARPAGTRVLDIGAGYGGVGRFLARTRGHHVTSLNLSTVQNRRNRERNAAAGLEEQVEVVDGSFEDLPMADKSFDVVWSQDALLHSGRRQQVFAEVNRVLRPGGEFIFTDPMQVEGVDPEILEPVLARIHLASMGSIPTYRTYAKELGWTEVMIDVERAIVAVASHCFRRLRKAVVVSLFLISKPVALLERHSPHISLGLET